MNILNPSIIIFIFVFFLGCKTEYFNSIPDVPVYLELNISTSDLTLSAVNSSAVYKTPRTLSERLGFGGILVYHGVESGASVFYAYDLACPYEARRDVQVEVKDVVLATCPKCGSKFEIASGIGNPINGPAKYPLKRYSSSSSNDINIVIHN